MRRARYGLALAVLGAAVGGGCRRIEPARLDPVRALKTGVRPGFRAPDDGLLKPAQLDLFLRVRARMGGGAEADAVAEADVDPAEYAWVRARIREALLSLNGERVAAAASESYGRGLAALREARKTTRDPKAIARLDLEIATLERERAALRRSNPASTSLARNASLLAPRRTELETAAP